MKAPLTEREQERLDALRDYRILDTPDERAYDDLVALAAQICDVPIALISLVDSNRQWFKSGRISSGRLEQSLQRRERALGLVVAAEAWSRTGTGDLERLESGSERALARELVEVSLEVKSNAGLPPGPGLNLIRLDSNLASPFLPLMAPALQRPAQGGYAACLIDGRSPSPWSGNAAAPLALERLPPGPVLLQLFVRGNPFRGSAGGEEPWPAVISQLLAAGRLAGLAAYGSPYLWQALQPLLPDGLPAAYSPGQMPLAQAILLDALDLTGGGLEGGFTD